MRVIRVQDVQALPVIQEQTYGYITRLISKKAIILNVRIIGKPFLISS